MSNDRYNYSPSLPAAIIFVVCFSFSSLAHVFQIGRFRSWFFIPFLIGCLIEAVGYGARAFNASEPHGKWSLPPYIIQALLLLLGPPFFAASIYMVLGRLIGLLDAEKYSLISLKWLTKFFLLGDVASIFAQAIGGGKLSGAKTKQDRDQGQLIIIIGLAIQLVFFGFFIIATSIFHWRIRKTPTNKSFNAGVHWEKLLYVLYGASVLIMVRSIFRVAEYILGED
ncbi:Fc.00g073450.m01.CDS01, partial [Cosmosporella sp. VM-42]